MSDAQAGTPPANAESSQQAENQQQAGQDDSGLNAQQKKEWMALKQKAEEFNKLAEETKSMKQRLAEYEQAFAARGAGQATDPTAEMIAKLREQAPYDPASQAALLNLEMTAKAQAEAWLAGQLVSVPEKKRDKVAALVRNSMYQMSVQDALSLVTDPDAMTYQERLAEAERELERLRGSKPHGSSPAATTPATSSADDGGGIAKEIKRSEYIATLNRGGPEARALMASVGSNKTRLVDD